MRNLNGVQIPEASHRQIAILAACALSMRGITIFEFQRPCTADCTSQKFRVDGLIDLLRESRLQCDISCFVRFQAA